MKQLEVTILGQSYLLACPDGGEQQLHAAVATVDHEMSAIRDAGKVRARERIAVLAALNLAYRLAAQPAAAAAVAKPLGVAAPADAADDRVLDLLIQRLDTALGSDGQLL